MPSEQYNGMYYAVYTQKYGRTFNTRKCSENQLVRVVRATIPAEVNYQWDVKLKVPHKVIQCLVE